jgi:uncharacterized protein (UPF0332 family)
VTEQNKLENAKSEAALGDDAQRAAVALLDLDLPNDAVSRAYYAVFHYARAILLMHGLEPKTHRGVISTLEKSAGLPGWPSRDAISQFARLQTFRAIADYDSRERVSIERARGEVSAAELFIAEATALLRAAR